MESILASYLRNVVEKSMIQTYVKVSVCVYSIETPLTCQCAGAFGFNLWGSPCLCLPDWTAGLVPV